MIRPFPYAFIAVEHDTQHRLNRVINVSAQGEILRQLPVEYPLDIELLPDGNLLLSSNLAGIELDEEFQEVWRYAINKVSPFACRRLPNGSTLYGDTSRAAICEISPDRKSFSIFQNQEVLLHPPTHIIL